MIHKRRAITTTDHGMVGLVARLLASNIVQIPPTEVARRKAMAPNHTTAGIREKGVRPRFMPP
jgi:hypothetical protein